MVSHVLCPYMCLCWMLRPPSGRFFSPCLSHCLALFPVTSNLPCCFPLWCVRLADFLSLIVSDCLPLSPHAGAGVGKCVCLVSHCRPTCVPVVDGVPAFPRSCPPLSWMVYLPFRSLVSLVSQLVFLLVPACLPAYSISLLVSLCGGWSHFAFSPGNILLVRCS